LHTRAALDQTTSPGDELTVAIRITDTEMTMLGIAGPYLAPSSASIDGAGSELSVEARVEALDGSERKLLLDQLARAYPDVVEAGFELVAQWRTECAEKRRARLTRHEHDRRRRRAAELEGLKA
jgi:hypothetical protein